LLSVDEIRELPSGSLCLFDKTRRSVVGIVVGIVATNRQELSGRGRRKLTERGLDMADIGAVVADKGHHQNGFVDVVVLLVAPP
jgi:hypothetical protein